MAQVYISIYTFSENQCEMQRKKAFSSLQSTFVFAIILKYTIYKKGVSGK